MNRSPFIEDRPQSRVRRALPFDPASALVRSLDELRREPRITRALLHASALSRHARSVPDAAATARSLIGALPGADALSTLGILEALAGVDAPAADRVLAHTARAAPVALALPARCALAARQPMADRPESSTSHTFPFAEGLLVIQPFLHARLDRAGSGLGAGDAGGIASLLRSLGTALAAQPGIGGVITVTRRREGEGKLEELAPGHVVERIAFGGPGTLASRDAWVWYAQITQALLDLGRSLQGRRVVWHLRMGDVGSLAAASVARRLGQPFVFTAVPDPHTEIAALQTAGRLDRSSFLREELDKQFWLRARVVERLAQSADRLVLLPRPTIHREMVELLGIEPTDLAMRAVVVPEGVDLEEIDRGHARRTQHGISATARAVLAALPAARRHLPWVVSVGRLHASKGMERLARAIAQDERLAARVNLVLVGGDLENPSTDERATLAAIVEATRGAAPGVVTMLGHLPPAAVSDLLAELVARGGLYVCASAKEEFGLAVVEALGAGAVVVAPVRGGPRTYVEQGVTGILCDTTDVHALRVAVERGLGLVAAPARADRARTMVRAELGVSRMAVRLARIYRDVAPRRSAA